VRCSASSTTRSSSPPNRRISGSISAASLKNGFDGIGEVVGHSKQGSVEVPLGIFTGIEASEDNRDTLLQLTEEAVRRKLFEAMGVEGGESTNGS
jgi:nanoRNase/pAp phosphatase (c-di-AMP/oligoRNAs hydrolase)